ncbi:insulinase family protein [Tsuneonella sp. YG55]|uniref:Insulinase family protein n=1 Tax=Tsuneonella litorea TaxID=2976475 RepID=A0A9X2W248_9SPHN|nr:pitrilysin family protein [Tsuneonella litorea]MCT2559662.1 insulinase family protein [Tsuneonella litorea]
MTSRFAVASLLALALTACAAQPVETASTPAPAPSALASAEPAPVEQLISAVNIPYERFTLDNGLTVLVHTDRKAPIVGVTTYYRVGSKHEPRGRTGFAHLFEHLMFGGSENVPNFDIPLEAAGSTSTNGSTWYDRTNYVETVPTGALDLALFMESDRMGHLLGAVTQDKLDKQRGVVQNEKRQGDNQPYGLVEYKIGDALFPVGHPYRHSTIGSMADLEAANLSDVRKWFTDNYAPNNVVLALTGDIDAQTARPLVEKWFGDIPRGPEVPTVTAPPVPLAAAVREEMTDQVPVTRIIKVWTGPNINHPDAVALDMGMSVLGGLGSSRLDNALVKGDEIAVSVSAYEQQHENLSFLQAQMDVKPGVDPALAERRFDEVIAKLVSEGPEADELLRAVNLNVSNRIGAMELVGGFSGKGATLAEGLLYSDDPARYKKELGEFAALTPAVVKDALGRWLARPSYTLVVKPGERTEDGALMGGWGDEGSVPPPAPDAKNPAPPLAKSPPRKAPPVAPVGELTFPSVETAKLANGIPVRLARRTSIPKISMAITFDAGTAADGPSRAGTQAIMMGLLDEGTDTLSAIEIAEAKERLGAQIGAGTSLDTSSVSMTALTANLRPSLALLADIVRNPAFADSEVARVKAQRLAAIAQAQANPSAIASRALGPLVYGPAHPYGAVGGAGLASAISPLTSTDLEAVHETWVRPDTAAITVVGDVTMEQLLPALEASFGDWRAPARPVPAKNLGAPTPAPKQRIVVIDRPNSPQSVLLLGRQLPVTGRTPGLEPLDLANEVIGSGFLSRLNMDLREDKGWTYGVRSALTAEAGPRTFYVITPVQSDRTGDSIRLVLDKVAAFADGQSKVDDTEFQRVTEGNIRGLPNRFETNGQVLNALLQNQLRGRPDGYQRTLPQVFGSVEKAAIDAAAARFMDPSDMVIIVVGDRSKIDDQVKALGLPVEYRDAGEF